MDLILSILHEASPILVAAVAAIGGVLVAKINQIQKDARETKRQVSNDHATSKSPANLRVQMDQIQLAEATLAETMATLAEEHRQYRAGNDAVIREIRASQQANIDLTMRSIDTLQRAVNSLTATVTQIIGNSVKEPATA